MTVRAVLDTSAVLGYASVHETMPVSELVRMIGEENEAIGDEPDDPEASARISQVGIPTSAFVAAFTQTDAFGRDLLRDLAADMALAEELGDPARSTFVFLPLTTVGDVLEAGELEQNWPGQGEALHHATRHNAVLATFRPPKSPPAGVRLADLSAGWDD